MHENISLSSFLKTGNLAALNRRALGSNHWICHTGQWIWLIGVDANEDLFASFYPPANWEGDEWHNQRVRLPIRPIDSQGSVPTHHDFGGAGDRRPVFVPDITNYARVPADALNFVRIVRGQKLDTSIVDGEPYRTFISSPDFL